MKDKSIGPFVRALRKAVASLATGAKRISIRGFHCGTPFAAHRIWLLSLLCAKPFICACTFSLGFDLILFLSSDSKFRPSSSSPFFAAFNATAHSAIWRLFDLAFQPLDFFSFFSLSSTRFSTLRPWLGAVCFSLISSLGLVFTKALTSSEWNPALDAILRPQFLVPRATPLPFTFRGRSLGVAFPCFSWASLLSRPTRRSLANFPGTSPCHPLKTAKSIRWT